MVSPPLLPRRRESNPEGEGSLLVTGHFTTGRERDMTIAIKSSLLIDGTGGSPIHNAARTGRGRPHPGRRAGGRSGHSRRRGGDRPGGRHDPAWSGRSAHPHHDQPRHTRPARATGGAGGAGRAPGRAGSPQPAARTSVRHHHPAGHCRGALERHRPAQGDRRRLDPRPAAALHHPWHHLVQRPRRSKLDVRWTGRDPQGGAGEPATRS